MSFFKSTHIQKPFCHICKYLPNCKLTYKACHENTKWLKPCLQDCLYHGACKKEAKDDIKGEITYKCFRYKRTPLKVKFVPISNSYNQR